MHQLFIWSHQYNGRSIPFSVFRDVADHGAAEDRLEGGLDHPQVQSRVRRGRHLSQPLRDSPRNPPAFHPGRLLHEGAGAQ